MNARFLPLLVAAALAVSSQAQDKKPAGDAKSDKAVAAAKVDFEKEIFPILEKRCVECHSTAKAGPDGRMKKPKGGVVLDSKDGITSSKKGKLVVAKKHADSLLFKSTTLPADDEDRMPPAKKGDPLSKEQTDLIQKWIDEGANFGTWTGKKEGADKPAGDKPAGSDKGKSDKPGEASGDKPKGKEHG